MKVLYERDRGDLYRINRGGGWHPLARYCRAAHRIWCAASRRDRSLGFQPLIKIKGLGGLNEGHL